MERNKTRFLIVGNGFAGTSCAQQLRRIVPDAEITLFGAEPHPIYNRLSLPPFLRGEISRDKIVIHDDAWHRDQRIDLKLSRRVDQIIPAEGVAVSEGEEFPYDSLLLATGGTATEVHCNGDDDHSTNRFQTLDDAVSISDAMNSAKAAIAVGGSFIGYELAEAFAARNIESHWVVRGPRVFHRLLDEVAAGIVQDAAVADGVTIHCNESLKSVQPADGGRQVVCLEGGLRIEGECVATGVGLAVNAELAEGTQIRVNDGFVCNEWLETDEPGIYAAGDCAEFYDPMLDARYRMGTWNSAGAQGRLAAINMAGGHQAMATVPEYSTKLFSSQKLLQFGLSPAISPDLDTVRTANEHEGHYRCLHFRGGRLVGGLMIGNEQGGKRKYVQAIRSGGMFEKSERAACLEWRA